MTELEQAILNLVKDAVDQITAPNRLYNIDELAERYHRPKTTIASWVRAGRFGDAVRPDGNNPLVTEEGVIMFDQLNAGPSRRRNPQPGKGQKRAPKAPLVERI